MFENNAAGGSGRLSFAIFWSKYKRLRIGAVFGILSANNLIPTSSSYFHKEYAHQILSYVVGWFASKLAQKCQFFKIYKQRGQMAAKFKSDCLL